MWVAWTSLMEPPLEATDEHAHLRMAQSKRYLHMNNRHAGRDCTLLHGVGLVPGLGSRHGSVLALIV